MALGFEAWTWGEVVNAFKLVVFNWEGVQGGISFIPLVGWIIWWVLLAIPSQPHKN